MKLFLTAFVVMMPLAAADSTPAKPRTPAPAPKAGPKAIQIPEGAVETQAGTYTHTDASGKKWIYRKTPFGVARMEDNGPTPVAPLPASETAKSKVKAVQDGDTVHFERPGPFGVYRWNRKKSELSADERDWLAASDTDKRSTARQE